MLTDVLGTEITPELVPTGEDEEVQRTEDSDRARTTLQDFTLFHVLRFGFRPSKIAFLAWHAWRDRRGRRLAARLPRRRAPAYALAEIRRWLEVFLQRFFGFAQFKRSAMPNGPEGRGRRLALPARRLARAVRPVGARSGSTSPPSRPEPLERHHGLGHPPPAPRTPGDTHRR